MSDYSNKLIYGKDTTERIVALEVDNDELVVFQEMKDGSIVESRREAKFWAITNRKVSDKQTALEGDQFFKYLAEFDNQEEYQELTKKLYQKRMEFYRIFDPVEANMVRQGITFFKGMRPSEVSILSWDIESDGLKKTKDSEVYIISNTYRSATGEILRHSFCLDDYESQADMIDDWCDFVREMNPSIMLGHNIYGYDWGYLDHVARLNGTSLKLGRNGSEIRFNNKPSQKRKDGSQSYEYYKVYVYGRTVVDSFFVSLDYDISRSFPSYGLKPIVKHLGLEKSDRTFIDASMIKKYYYARDTYPGMWEKTKLYADDDSDDALKLYDLMIPAKFYFTQSVSKTFQEMCTSSTGTQMNNLMVRSYLQENHSIAKADDVEPFQGAISLGVPGSYKNCVRWDIASLYPSIIRQYKIYNKRKDPNSNFLKLTNYFALERLKNKKLAKETGEQYYKDLEQTQKVGANSLYGFLSAKGLNYNYPTGGSEITARGRQILTQAVYWASGKKIEELVVKDDDEEM